MTEQKENAEGGSDLLEADVDMVDAISYNCNDEIQTLLKTGDGWVSAEDASLKLDQDAVESMLDTIDAIQYEKVVADSLTSSVEYGFEQPATTVTLSLSDGTQKILYLGTENTMAGVRYAIVEGDQHIYAVEQNIAEIFQPVSQLTVPEEAEDSGDSDDSDDLDDSDGSDGAADSDSKS